MKSSETHHAAGLGKKALTWPDSRSSRMIRKRFLLIAPESTQAANGPGTTPLQPQAFLIARLLGIDAPKQKEAHPKKVRMGFEVGC